MKAHIQLAENRSRLSEWLLLMLALMTVGGMLAVWYSLERARVTAFEKDRLGALSRLLVKDVAVNLVAINNAIQGVIRDRLDADPVDHAAVSTRLRALVESMPTVRGILVMDPQGKIVAATPGDLVGRNFAQRPYFALPKQRGDARLLYLAPPFRSIRGDVVMTAARLIPGAGPFRGVVTVVLDPGYFSDILHTALYAPDVRVTIAHSDGGAFIDVGARAMRAAEEELGASATVVPAGLRTDSNIVLAVRRDLATVHAPLNRQALVFAGVWAMLAVAGAGCLAWVQVRRRRNAQAELDLRDARLQADALSASEARFRTLIEEAPIAVAIARQGSFIYTNWRYNLLHGYAAAEDLTGMPWRRMIAPCSLETLQEELVRIDHDAPVEQRFEAIGLGKDDVLVPVLKATARVLLGDGPATLIFVQDITAQKSAEGNLLEARDAAQAANRSKADFLANMSHEIRTPLNAILGMAYLLERGNRDADATSMLHKIRIAGRSLLGIINDILDVSKIEAGAMALERNWFLLQDVIDTVAATMGVAVGAKPIALLVRPLPPLAASVLGDALRIEQLLVNLTSNAIKFTDSGSVELTVEAYARGEGEAELQFRVTDTGIGVAATEQENIFSPFIQADSSTTRRYGGSGLGLTICKQIVTLLGGEIGMHSVPGAGSTFWFNLVLPVRPALCASSPEMVDLEVWIDAADDPAHDALADTARALGWHVHSIASGADALACGHGTGRSALPGVLILNCPPGAACMATARALRADGTADASAIVMLMSTYQAASFENDPERALADALLTRPVTSSTLYNAVLEAKRKRLGRDVAAAPRPVSQSLDGVRVMVVDDSGINRDVAARILAEEGAQVILAENGRKAIDWLLAHPGAIDLVLMDVQMPVMDGIEATRILRSMPAFAQLPIVALTAGAFSAHQDAARDAGMNHFIAKPFDIPMMIELIRRLTIAGPGGAGVGPAPSGPAADAPDALDLRRGLQTWGTRPNYQRYLRKFAAAYDGVVARLRRDLDAGNTGAVAALAHKLGGAAANVALPAVTDLARRLETALANPVAAAALVEELDVAMGAALAAMQEIAPPMANLALPAASLAPCAALLPLLERMTAALEEGMPEPALAALAELAPHVPPALLAPIAECIDDFDWPGAARHAGLIAQHHQLILPR